MVSSVSTHFQETGEFTSILSTSTLRFSKEENEKNEKNFIGFSDVQTSTHFTQNNLANEKELIDLCSDERMKKAQISYARGTN